jgi:hypothetical protein
LSEFFLAFWYALVGGDLRWNLLGDHLTDLVGVLPVDVAEQLVE